MEKNIRRKYPLTEQSKRERITQIRMKNESKCQQIKKNNETIKRGAEAIRDHVRKKCVSKLESLVKIKNHSHNDNSSIYETDLPSTLPFSKKLELFELKLKQLQNELAIERNRLTMNYAAEKKQTIVDDDPNEISMCDKITINGTADVNDGVLKEDCRNSLERFDGFDFTDNCSLYKYAYGAETVSNNPETSLTFSPKQIQFRVIRENLNLILQNSFRKNLTIKNYSKNTMLCRFSHLFDPNGILQNNMNVVQMNSVGVNRFLPSTIIDYVVTFNPAELPNSRTYPSLEGVKLVFETANNNRPDVKYALHVPIEFCMAKPEPELLTNIITFPVAHYSRENINRKKYLILRNNGDAECAFSVIRETEYVEKSNNIDDSSYCALTLNSTETVENNKNNMFKDIIGSAISTMFSYFMWKNHTNVLLPAKKSVNVPVIFNEHLACSSTSERYIIAFDNTEFQIPNLKVNVIGRVKNENILVKPDMIDAGTCYLTSSVQAVVSFYLHNDGRMVVPFTVELPRELSKHIKLGRSKGYVKAGSSLDVFIRICLKYDILQSEDCSEYFNADNGSLHFPVWIYLSGSKKCQHEVRVTAIVTTPFGLTSNPDTLDFGTVGTTETVVRSVALTNHSRATMSYGFSKLPKKVSIHPTAFGTIFSGESVLLHVYYSPSAKDLPRNAHTFEDEFVLTCNTITGLNSEIKTTTAQFHQSFKVTPTAIGDKKSTLTVNQINELDHGPDKILEDISKLKYPTEVNSLDGNIILKAATIKCRARIHDIPVEISVQKIIFRNTQFMSYSTFKIELRASNLASLIERNVNSFPDFKIKFEFVTDDSSVEFKPKNGILRSKQAIQICVTFRPKFDHELQKMYEKCLESEVTKFESEKMFKNENSCINQIYGNEPLLYEKIKAFEANKIFYTSMTDKTKIVSAVCFVRFLNEKSKEYFGFDTESLKLSLVCPTTNPNVVLFNDQIRFGRCTMGVRHNEWLLLENITAHPVPLKISLPNPVGPFVCDFALMGEQSILPGRVTKIKIAFTPEYEMTVNEVLEITSETMRFTITLCGSGIVPSCKITPDDVFNIIQTTYEYVNNTFIFRVTNTSGAGVRFDVQMEWAKERTEPMTDEEAYALAVALRRAGHEAITASMEFDGPDWMGLLEDDGGGDVFDLGNGGRPLWFRLDSKDVRYVQVTFKPQRATPVSTVEILPDVDRHAVPARDVTPAVDYSSSVVVFRRRVYAAKFNVHVGRSVLHQFYAIGFVDET